MSLDEFIHKEADEAPAKTKNKNNRDRKLQVRGRVFDAYICNKWKNQGRSDPGNKLPPLLTAFVKQLIEHRASSGL
jgi:hypothetical protein